MDIVQSRQSKGLNRDTIKYIAMFTMLLNHIAQVFLTPGTWLYEIFLAVGYFTAITMIYFLVEGYQYTRSKKTYITRLFVFGLIAEIPYCLAFTKDAVLEYYNLNMLFTLCLCFLVLWVHENITVKSLRVLIYIGIVLLSVFFDWALLAPIFTLLFIWAGKKKEKLLGAFGMAMFLFGGMNYLSGIGRFSTGVNLLYALLSIVGIGVAAICIVYLYNGKRMERAQTFSKWFFYLFYRFEG